jgi:hypothetical protein
MTVPATSPSGQLLRAGTPLMVINPRPIGDFSKGFGGNIGAVFTVAANTNGIATEQGYFGDFPESEQGLVTAPDPWNRV